jgi:CubicO group peptidase (beta-lactamase class C family)
MTKLLTSVGIMILHERGEFLLNDPIARYLPEFANPQVIAGVDEEGNIVSTVAATQPIRIVHLLSHSSGISYPFIPTPLGKRYTEAGIIDGPTSQPYTLREQMQLLAAQPLLFEPGTRFAYGLNTDVLGYLIEVVTGKTLAQFFVDEITGPLGMADTHFYLPEESAGRLATIYAENGDEELIAAEDMELPITLGSANYPVEGARSHFSGGSGLSSTATDYARLLQMLLNHGELDGIRILGRKSVELMSAPRVALNGGGNPDFGLGLEVTENIGNAGVLGSPGTLSWGGAFDTSFWIDPAEGMVAVFMTQVAPANVAIAIERDIEVRFRTMVYQALE